MTDPGSEKQSIKKYRVPFWYPERNSAFVQLKKLGCCLTPSPFAEKKPNTICFTQGIKTVPSKSVPK